MRSPKGPLQGWIALTGTPGVGKTTLAEKLRVRAIATVNLGRFAHDYDLVEGVDAARTAAIVDPRKVGPALASVTQRSQRLVLDGHWSHDVPGVQQAIVLRLRPSELRTRLERRGWAEAKIRENLEAEAIDLILQEAVANLGPDAVYEVDTTSRGVEAVEADVLRLLAGRGPDLRAHRPGRVDWSHELVASPR